MSLSNLIREHSRRTSPHLLYTLTFVRSMGGGPRTFPGGLNKWQWKRMHEKKAREKENKLLEQEKQLYQSRIRSQIRAKLVGESDSKPTKSDPNGSHNYAPMTPKDHIKALADRFMTEGAEDLWNEADGPIRSPSPSPSPPIRRNAPIGAPIDLRNLVSGRDGERTVNLGNLNGAEKARDYSVIVRSRIKSRFDFWRNESSIDLGILVSGARTLGDGERTTVNLVNLNGAEKCRHYSVVARRRPKSRFDFRRKENSTSDDDSELEDGSVRMSVGNAKWPRFGLIRKDEEVEEDDDDEMEGKENVKKLMSSAALGKYDSIKRRRVPLKFLEEEVDVSGEVDLIRNELKKRNLNENLDQKSDDDTIISQKRFDECDISPLTVKALNGAGYMRMTRVQEATLSACLEGKDALVKAKTGTGKSAAFLLPAIETVLKASNSNTNQRVQPIYVLVLCPTRELASQLAAEANVMLKYHDGIGVQTLVGGTRFKLDQKRLDSDPCQIIVATPGRLLDHIENKSGFSARLMGLKMLILDEADHLLDLGFRKDVEKIVDCVPRQRQSLLFSATLPKEVRRISQLVLKREHVYIDTVGLGCLETHSKVKQSYLVAPHELNFQLVHHLLKEHISEVVDYKVLVFCTTAMVTSLMFLLLREMKMNVREIHSRKPQLYRTRISDEFRESKRLILITSDVSARGMNYPDVTLVIQVGIPSDREQYIHRLGRTGREGKAGEGILLLAPWEEYFLDEINDLPLEKYLLPHVNPFIKVQMEDSMRKIDSSIKEAAYHAWLGYYNSIREIGRDKTTLVELANQFSESIGLQKPPSLFRKTAIKMGLKDIPGIRVRK